MSKTIYVQKQLLHCRVYQLESCLLAGQAVAYVGLGVKGAAH